MSDDGNNQLTTDQKWERVVSYYKEMNIKFTAKPDRFAISGLYNNMLKFKLYAKELALKDPAFHEKTLKTSTLKKISSKRAEFWAKTNQPWEPFHENH